MSYARYIALGVCIAAQAAAGQSVVGFNDMPDCLSSPLSINVPRDAIYAASNRIDGATNQVSRAPASADVVNPFTQRGYSRMAPSGIATIDYVSDTAAVIATPYVTDLALDARADRLYALSQGQVSIIAGVNVLSTVTVSADADAIAVNTTTNRIYVSGNPMTVIDGATGTVTPLAASSLGRIAINEATNHVYASIPSGVLDIDAGTGTIVAIPFPEPPSGQRARDIAVDPVRNLIYASYEDHNPSTRSLIEVVRGSDRTTTAVFLPDPSRCCDLQVDAAAGKVYALAYTAQFDLAGQGGLHVIDEGTLAVTSTSLAAGTSMALNPVTRRLYAEFRFPFASPNCLARVSTLQTDAGTTSAGPSVSIARLDGDQTMNRSVRLVLTAPALGYLGAPVRAVYYQLDSTLGPWLFATKVTRPAPTATYVAETLPLSPGTHTLYAFAADSHMADPAPITGAIASYTFTVAACDGVTMVCADLRVSQSASIPRTVGHDVVYDIEATNDGPHGAANVQVQEQFPGGTTYVWVTPGSCAINGGSVTCGTDFLGAGSAIRFKVVVRPSASGNLSSTATVTSSAVDLATTNNTNVEITAIAASPAANLVPRYRLYSPVTLEHHYTTDLNEYNVLGTMTGSWIQEGAIGRILDNPGAVGGVTATPYYRLYNVGALFHLWTTDPNEYYTLAATRGWSGEGVDGFILPAQAPGSIPLYRLYLPGAGQHHWPTDANENAVLISSYGWVSEGIVGYLMPMP